MTETSYVKLPVLDVVRHCEKMIESLRRSREARKTAVVTEWLPKLNAPRHFLIWTWLTKVFWTEESLRADLEKRYQNWPNLSEIYQQYDAAAYYGNRQIVRCQKLKTMAQPGVNEVWVSVEDLGWMGL